ncbi:hypothetical protein ACB092_11G176900 [Castanea dentata]
MTKNQSLKSLRKPSSLMTSQSKEQKDIFVQLITYLKYSHTLYYVILGWKVDSGVFEPVDTNGGCLFIQKETRNEWKWSHLNLLSNC